MNRRRHHELLKAAASLLERWTRPANQERDDTLRYWQERLLQTMLLASVGFGFLAYVPSMWLSIKEGLWAVALADTLIYGLLCWVFAYHGLAYAVRSWTVISISYVLGLVLVAVLGPFGAGPVWLFAFPVIAGILSGLWGSVAALTVNALTLVAIGLLIHTGTMGWLAPMENPVAKWAVSGANFMLLDTVVAISITVLLAGLRSSLSHEKALRASLEIQNRDLETTHQRLSLEIQERKSASALLEESQGRLKAILDSVKTGILIIDARTREIKEANPAAAAMMGTTTGDAVGRPCDRYLKGLIGSGSQGRVVVSGQVNETDLIAADGGRRPIMINTVPVTLNHRPHFLASFLDVSRLRKAEEDRARLETELAQARKMEAVGTLAGGIAHDFNNILAAVIGFTELALDLASDNPTQQDHLREVIRAGGRAKEMVRQILAFSRQDARRVQPMVLGDTIRETMRLIRATIPATVDIRTRIDSDGLVLADPTQMHQIVMNLCTNAWHAMEEDRGTLEVGLGGHDGMPPRTDGQGALPPGDYLHLWVRDTGSGMGPETVARIFDPFFTTKPAGEGTGMGLSVVHGIVESHNGSICVESALGAGTTLHVYLPAAGAAREEEERHGAAGLPGGDERILVVDDEPQVIKVHCKALQGLGYRVEAAPDGLSALERLKRDPADFDLVISDLAMPGMAGDELMQAIHDCLPQMPVVLCTGYSRRFSPEELKALGAAAVGFKPMTRKDLARLVRRVLDGRPGDCLPAALPTPVRHP